MSTRKDATSSGSNMAALALAFVVGLALGLGGMRGYDNKQAPHTTPGPGPSAPSGRVAIDGTSADCWYSKVVLGKDVSNKAMSDGTVDDTNSERTMLINDQMSSTLAKLNASAKKLVADAITKRIGSNDTMMTINQAEITDKTAIVDLASPASKMTAEVNGMQNADVLGPSSGLDKLTSAKVTADVQTLQAAAKDAGLEPHDFLPGTKGGHDNVENLANKESTLQIRWPQQ